MSSNAGPLLMDEVRTLRARLTNADDRLRDYEEDMAGGIYITSTQPTLNFLLLPRLSV
jgi:hypothetical protein